MNPVEPAAPPLVRTRGALRLRTWPGDDRVGVVLPTDHQAVPRPTDVACVVGAARSRGMRALRTGALFPAAAAVFHDAGFHDIDTLALLEVHLADVVVPAAAPAHRVRPLRRWQHDDAAAVDRRAFGELWGNDAATIREVRGATPVHHARRVDVDGALAGIAITGAAGRTGYLQRIAVDPAHQRRGVALALVVDAVAWMQRRGLRDAVVNTGVGNEPALRLYERLGFHRRDEHLVIAEIDLDAPERAAAPGGTAGHER